MKSLNLIINALAIAVSLFLTTAKGEPLTMTIDVGDKQRQALIFPPVTATDSTAKVPTVFVFHGHGWTAPMFAKRMNIAELWPEALVVYMQGLRSPGMVGDPTGQQPGWQFTPGQAEDRDLKFFDAVLTGLEEKYPIDKHRVYAAGTSNGGSFVYLLWAERPNVFAAIAAGSCRILPEVKITKPLPLLHFVGRNDMRVLAREQQETIDAIKKLNGCAGDEKKLEPNLTLYPSAGGTPVYWYSYEGGHDFPAATAEVTVRFFKEQAAKP